jgi:uncharacterized protein (DUF433 family)
MSNTAAFTAAQVAFVLREPVKTVKKALDEGPVRARPVQKASGTVRTVDWKDLLYLFAVRSLREELTPAGRVQLYHAIRRTPIESEHEVRFGLLRVAIDDMVAQVRDRERELAELAEKVEFRQDGEALLKGTDIEVYRISALLDGGMTPEEILEDYPSLTAEPIATAEAYAAAYPKAGRPFPSTTVKRAAKGAGIGFEALDEVMDVDEDAEE